MPFNYHVHDFGENSKGCFCLRCGEFFDKKEEDNHSVLGMRFFQPNPKPDVMWPTGKSKKKDYLDNDY